MNAFEATNHDNIFSSAGELIAAMHLISAALHMKPKFK